MHHQWTLPFSKVRTVYASALVCILVLHVPSLAMAQDVEAEWQLAYPEVSPGPRARHAMSFDSAREVTVLFGSQHRSEVADTWEWDGTEWRLVSTIGPEPRNWHAMVYDSVRGVTVLFGGRPTDDWDALGDTWEWDGVSWSLVSESGPEPRQGHAMAYDSARGVTVLFGGYGSNSKTWEWDGSSWTLRSETGPEGRHDHAMAYDTERSRTVLFAGRSDYGDTWEWDGESWDLVADSGPHPRWGHAMVYDSVRQVCVMFGGFSLADTWAWNGLEWSLLDDSGFATDDVAMHAMAFDESHGVTVMFGGDGALDETWEWNGEAWAMKVGAAPSPRREATTVFDERRQVMILFGGEGSYSQLRGDTWQWDGVSWERVAITGPQPRCEHAMAYDSKRGVIVLQGGRGIDGWISDTWEWDGHQWKQVADQGPGDRRRHAMAYDSAREVVVLHGGVDPAWNELGDTWEWDGSLWKLAATDGPRARQRHAMAFHETHGVTVLFGGKVTDIYGDDFFLADTWVWDGSDWIRVFRREGPHGREGHGMVYHEGRDEVIIFGGNHDYREQQHLDDAWALSPTGWRLIDEGGPSPRSWHAMAYDRARESIVLFGGYDYDTSVTNDTWEFLSPGIHLDVFSTCPQSGPGRVQWSGATPGEQVAIMYSLDVGSFKIPAGYPCAGTQIDLAPNKIHAIWTGRAGTYGRDAIDLDMPARACGGALQLIDAATCKTSNVAVIE